MPHHAPMRSDIIIDTDPGQDDAFAILLALGRRDRLNLLGITTVFGSLPLVHTTRNALKILNLAGRLDVPVIAGSVRPLTVAPVTAAAIHGEKIAEGWDLPMPDAGPSPGFAPDWLIQAVMSRPAGTITLCALGPLTNVAAAFTADPGLARHLKQVVLMGGACAASGNMSPVAEFNVFSDPHAAAVVFAADVPKVVVPLDVTETLVIDHVWTRRVRGLRTTVSHGLEGILTFYERLAVERKPWPLHDPAVTAWILEPDLFDGVPANVSVQVCPGPDFGRTVLNRDPTAARPSNATWITSADPGRFRDLLIDGLARLP